MSAGRVLPLHIDLVILDHLLGLVAHVAEREDEDEGADERHHREDDGRQVSIL